MIHWFDWFVWVGAETKPITNCSQPQWNCEWRAGQLINKSLINESKEEINLTFLLISAIVLQLME